MKNGIKIMSLEGADILRHNIEGKYLAEKYDAVFSNSQLKDKLEGKLGMKLETRLKVKNDRTKDIINLKFNMPVTDIDTKKYSNYSDYIEGKKIKADNIRNILCEEGFKISYDKETTLKGSKKEGTKVIVKNNKYILIDRDGKELKEETIEKEDIEYKNWFRSSSKARVGECCFIRKELYDDIFKWQTMNINIPTDKEFPVVELKAYMALTSSTVDHYITINPEHILVIDDLESRRLTDISRVYVNENKECEVDNTNDYVKNILFDGQALLDDSLFGNSEAGMKLLRHHMFKACGFRTYISKFMKNHFKDKYETATILDRYGNSIKVKDIKLITTENAMKWEKFFDNKSEGFKQWKKAVNEDNNLFGVCKEDHESKFGDKQRMSYQMFNTLPLTIKEINSIAAFSIEYINKLKDDNKEFIKHLSENKSIVNPYEMMIDLFNHNDRFSKTELFKDFKADTVAELKKSLRKGKILTDGDNLTIVGNPYLMLLHAAGKVEVDEDGFVTMEDETLPKSDEYISVYTKRFEDGEELVAFRNPHNSPNNIGYHKNFRSKLIDEYFNFSNNIMAVNLVETEEQDLKNGEDMDSDFNFVTNNKIIANIVKNKVFRKYRCIVNGINQSKKKYIYTPSNQANIDNALAKGKNDIGISSNLAQVAMSKFANSGYKNQALLNKVIILSVLAQVAIDNAKRQYEVELFDEIQRLSNGENGEGLGGSKPLFFYYVSKNKSTEYKILVDGKTKRTYNNKYEAQQEFNRLKEKYKDAYSIPNFKIKEKEDKEGRKYYKVSCNGKEYKHKFNSYQEAELFKEGCKKTEKIKVVVELKEKSVKKNKESYDSDIKCPMNILQEIIDKKVKNESKKKNEKINTIDLLKIEKGKAKKEQMDKIIELVEKYDNSVKEFNIKLSEEKATDKRKEMKYEFKYEEEYIVQNIIDKISKMKLTDKTINRLIKSAIDKDDKNSNSYLRIKLLNVLYRSKKEQFLSQFSDS